MKFNVRLVETDAQTEPTRPKSTFEFGPFSLPSQCPPGTEITGRLISETQLELSWIDKDNGEYRVIVGRSADDRPRDEGDPPVGKGEFVSDAD